MDRRRFLQLSGLGLISIPLAEFLVACGDAAAVSPATAATRSTAATSESTPMAATTSAGTAVPPDNTTTSTAPVPAVVGAICREAWGAAPIGNGLVPHTIERLTVHHTATSLRNNSKAPSRLRGHQAYHQGLGWPDLAYHMAVDGDGNVYAARPTSARGDTATAYDPTGHFLVVAEGNFDEHAIPGAQLESMARVLAWAASTFGVDPATIRGHRDWTHTSCPGERFYPMIADGTLEAMVGDVMDSGGIDLRVVCDESAFAAVAAIESGSSPPPLAVSSSFYLRNSNSAGAADDVIVFGDADWLPVSGDFGE